jgi:GT2 family glycosyltransferase
MTTPPPFDRLSIVIVNYNTREDVERCLQALHQCLPLPEIIVVDNASSDGSAAMVRNQFPGVHLITPRRNTWFCGGNNLGIDAATRDYVLLLNPDTIAPPDALAALLQYADAHPQYAGYTGQLRYPDGAVQRTCSRLPTYPYLLLNYTPLGWLLRGAKARANARHWYDGWARDTDHAVEVIPGSCTMFRRGAARLNDALKLYFPEDDLGQRMKLRGFAFVAAARIIHREKSATNNWNATRIYFRDLMIYCRTWHGPARAALLWLFSRPLLAALWLGRRLRSDFKRAQVS